jgi:hypothetical protein
MIVLVAAAGSLEETCFPWLGSTGLNEQEVVQSPVPEQPDELH